MKRAHLRVVPGRENPEISISGSKNASMSILISSLILDGTSHITGVPNTTDIIRTVKLLRETGAKISTDRKDGLRIRVSPPSRLNFKGYENAGQIRSSVLLIGASHARRERLRIPPPGGCSIGPRPIDIHLEGFRKLGNRIKIKDDGIIETEPFHKNSGEIKFRLRKPSVGATLNLILASVKGEEGQRVILENCAIDPEVNDLICFLIRSGAAIKRLGSRTLEIKSRRKLRGTTYRVMKDRIETLTYVILAAALRKEAVIKTDYIPQEDLKQLGSVLELAGIKIIIGEEKLIVKHSSEREQKKHLKIVTGPYPHFSTDIQPLTVAFASTKLDLEIKEKVYPFRTDYIRELKKIGARIEVNRGRNSTTIKVKKSTLEGGTVTATDLRGGAALMIAAAASRKEVTINKYDKILRGYENASDKTRELGLEIKVEKWTKSSDSQNN